MAMSNEEIISPGPHCPLRGRTSGAGAQARGPVIDQEARDPLEALGRRVAASFRIRQFSANPFADLTREQRMARLDALAKLLDVAFIVPGTNIRYGIDGLIGLIR
jgi:hypothetical protein